MSPAAPVRAARTRPANDRPAGALLRTLSFLLGFTMPFISFSQSGQFTRALLSRVEAVDIVCACFVSVLLFSRRLRITWAFVVYCLALVISLVIATTTDTRGESLTAFAALLMAVLYYAVGRSIADQQVLVKALLTGLLMSTLIESVIVVHDYFLPKWFPTSHSDRVRGTFRSTAQLGGFGFTAAGILLSFGWVYFRSNWARFLVVIAGVMGSFFVLASTRRAGMFALLLWIGLFLLLGLKGVSRRAYWAVLILSVFALGGMTVWSSQVKSTHLFDRFNVAYEQVAEGRSFTHDQFYKAMDNLEKWFPFGVGVGQSHQVMVRYEAHNGHLGVLVEQGLLGFIGYYGLWLPLLRRKWGESFGKYTKTVKLVSMTFLCGAVVFMIHARQDRDRIFMLFLGMAPLIACATDEVTKRVARRRYNPPATSSPTVPPPGDVTDC